MTPTSDIEDPLASSPPISAQPQQYVSGSAISSIRGPAGFDDTQAHPQAELTVQAISIRVELYPDVALVEQTYTIDNPDRALNTTLGIEQNDPKYGNGLAIRTYTPLRSVGWLNGKPIPSEHIFVKRQIAPDHTVQGYRLGISLKLNPGKNVLTLSTVVQTVANIPVNGAYRPAAGGWSRLALRVNHFAWDWSPKEKNKDPEITVSVVAEGDVTLDRLEAEEWTPALSTGTSFWWRQAPRLVFKYSTNEDARRAISRDELEAMARQLLQSRPVGHLTVPDNAIPVIRPDLTPKVPQIDKARTKRALIVPTFSLALLLLAILIFRRYNRSQP